MELLEHKSEKLGTHHGGSERIESAEAEAQRTLGRNGPTRLGAGLIGATTESGCGENENRPETEG